MHIACDSSDFGYYCGVSDLDPKLKSGALSLALLAVLSVLYPLVGQPPYAYFSLMKIFIAGASAYVAFVVYRLSPKLVAVSALVLALGALELVGKMKRADWVPYNWAHVASFAVAGLLLLTWRERP